MLSCDEHDGGSGPSDRAQGSCECFINRFDRDDEVSQPLLHLDMTAKNVLRAAVVQTCSAAFSLPETLDKLDHYTRLAQQQGAQLAVFPEAL